MTQKSNLILKKNRPYRFRKEDLAKIKQIGFEQNIIDIIANLKNVSKGISIGGIFRSAQEIHKLATCPGITEFLLKARVLIAKNNQPLGSFLGNYWEIDKKNIDLLIEWAQKEHDSERLTPIIIKRIQKVAKILDSRITLLNLDELIELGESGGNIELLEYLKDRVDPYYLNRYASTIIPALAKHNLTHKVLQLTRLNIEPANLYFLFNYQAGDEELLKKKLESLQNEIESPELKAVLEDPELSGFISKVCTLTRLRFSIDQIDIYRKLFENSASLPLIFIFSQCTKTLQQDILEASLTLLEKTKICQAILSPNFLENVKQLHDEFGYNLNIRYDLTDYKTSGNYQVTFSDEPGRIFDLLEDQKQLDKILSENGTKMLKLIKGSFDFSQLYMYNELLDHPELLPTQEKLYEYFGYHLRDHFSSEDIKRLLEIEQDPDLAQRLFKQENKTLAAKLRTDLGFEFEISSVHDFLSISDDPETQASAFEEEKTNFIKEACSRNLSDLKECSRISENLEMRELVLKLNSSFSYRLSPKDEEALNKLLENTELQEKLFDPEKIKLLKRVHLGHLDPIEQLVKYAEIPLDFNQFLDFLSENLNYTFDYSEKKGLDGLLELHQGKGIIYSFINRFKEKGIDCSWHIHSLKRLIEHGTQHPLEEYVRIAVQFSAHFSFIFYPGELIEFNLLLDKGYSEDNINELIDIYKKRSPGRSLFSTNWIPNLICLRENSQTIESTAQELAQIGTQTEELDTLKHALTLMEIHRSDAIAKARDIQMIFPDYKYNPFPEHLISQSRSKTIIDPYILLGFDWSTSRILGDLAVIQRKTGDLPQAFTDGLIKSFQERGKTDRKIELNPDKLQDIHQLLMNYSAKAIERNPDEESLQRSSSFLFSEQVILLILEAPEKIDDILSLTESGILEHPSLYAHYLANLDNIMSIPLEKRQAYLTILGQIDDSPSQEIQRLKEQLISQILLTDNPEEAYSKISSVFERNNLPTVGKILRIFQILYPPQAIDSILTNSNLSPVLRKQKSRARSFTFYKDLLNVHILSANRSLREYMELIRNSESSLSLLDSKELDQLSNDELSRLCSLLNMFQTLYENSLLGHTQTPSDSSITNRSNLDIRINQFRKDMGITPDQKFSERLSDMFLKPLGFRSFNEALAVMRSATQQAHERSIDLVSSSYNGYLSIDHGSLLKGVDDHFIANILQNGSVAKEFLGASASSDGTPLDTDVAMVIEENTGKTFSETLMNSPANGYGNIILVIRDRGQFSLTTPETADQYDPDKLEIFHTGVAGKAHYGIRTGFPTTEIDFLIVKDSFSYDPKSLENLYYEIAQNGYYIPVVDGQGKIIFTPDLFDQYRKTFEGLDRYYGAELRVKSLKENDPLFSKINETVGRIKEDSERLDNVSTKIRQTVNEILSEHGIKLKERYDRGLIGAELLDIGSTGRHTNKPGDYDFDLTLRLDVPDMKKIPAIVRDLNNRLQPTENNSHVENNGYYQYRVIGANGITNQPLDIDIGFTRKSELAVFGSHDAVKEKLESIKEKQGEKTYYEVLASIVLTKQILSEGNAYKRVEHGGFGGIGVENWILANNGNIRQAFQTFWDAAHENGEIVPFEVFKEKYKIFNAGINIKHLRHDNYIANMESRGYVKMIQTIEKFLAQN